MVVSVILPAGNITQAARGFSSLLTKSSSDRVATAPSAAERRRRLSGPCRKRPSVCPCFISRRTMLPPIRPRPIMPSCMAYLPSDNASVIAASSIVARPDARSPLMCTRNARRPRSVSTSKSPRACAALMTPKLALLAGYRQILVVVGGDLQEHAAVGAALVGLSGGMQEARAEFGAGRDMAFVAHRQAHLAAGCRYDRHRVRYRRAAPRNRRRPDAAEMRLQPGAEIAIRRPPCASRRHCCRRCRDRSRSVETTGCSSRQRSRLLKGRGQFAGLDLGGFDVGLIERIDAEHRACDRDRHLEAEKFLADMLDRLHDDADHRMSGLFQRRQLGVMRGVVFAFGADVDEEAVVAVGCRLAERFAVDRDQALAVLAGGFGDQLLGPGAEIGDFRGRQDRHLVAAFEAGKAHGEAELHARIFMRRHVRPAGANHRERVLEQRADIDARGGGRHQPERRQHGIAAADGGVAVEDARKALLGRDLLQRRAGIGHRDEAVAGLVGADRLSIRARRNNPSSRSVRWCRRICWRR